MTNLPRSEPGRDLRYVGSHMPLLVLLLLPSAGFCYELTLGLDTSYVHDTNFYRTQTDEESADSIEPGGTIDFRHRGDRYRYQAKYAGSYQFYDDDHDDADGAEHRLRLMGSYDIDQLTTVELSNNFRDIRNARFTEDDIRDGDTGQDARDDRYQRNDLDLTLHRELTRNWEVELTATQQFVDFQRNVTRSDSDSYGFGTRVLYRFAPRHRFGGGASWVRQDFDGNDFRLDAEAEYLVADLAWVFDIGEEIQLVVNGGPAWIDTDEDSADSVRQTEFVGGNVGGNLVRANVFSCGFDDATATGTASRCNADTPGAEPIPADSLGDTLTYGLADGGSPVDDDDTTFFGGAALLARFSDWTVDTEIRRQQSPPSGDALAAKLTRFRWEFAYDPPLGRWRAYLAGSVERREAFSRSTLVDYTVVPGAEDAALRSAAFTRVRDSGDLRDNFTALIGARRQFTRNFSGDVAVSFHNSQERINGRETDEDTYLFAVTFSYVLGSFNF